MKWILIAILLYVIYLLIGALLPFAGTKKVTEDHRDLFGELEEKAQLTPVDRAGILEGNQDALDMRLYTISQAAKRIVISTFDLRPGESWTLMGSALLEAADQGVEVQILVDGLFGMVHMQKLPEFYALGTHENVEIRYYNPVHLLKPWTFNGRLHDKYVLVDDTYLILGGRNIFDYFLGEYEGKSQGYDRDIFVWNTAAEESTSANSIIGEVDAYFQNIWDRKDCQTVFDKTPYFKKQSIETQQEDFRSCRWRETIEGIDNKTVQEITVPIEAAALVVNPVHILNKEPLVWQEMADLMKHAEERGLLQTPYAVLSEDMEEDLREIARQVPQAELLLNGIAVGDNIMASSDYLRRRDQVIDTGMDLKEYQGNHSMHAKSILIDQDISVIGSYNLDMRSTYIDTETMIVVKGEAFNQMLEDILQTYMDESLTVDPSGDYIEKDGIAEKMIKPKKYRFLKTISIFSPIFRNLI